MIVRTEMFASLLVADPTFEPKWCSFVAEYADEPELPYYIVLGDLADHLIGQLERGETGAFGKVFDVIERWHVEGDVYVSEAATIGLLEGLQNRLGGNDRRKVVNGVRASDFEPYLRPETRRWWDKLYRYWEGDIAALRFDTQ